VPEFEERGAELLSLQRLEADFGRHRAEFQRTRDDVLSFGSELANLKTGVQGSIADLRASVNALAAKLDEKGKTNWPAVALAISIVPALWLFVTTYTQNAIAPSIASTAVNSKAIEQQGVIVAGLQQSTAGSARADEASRTDRAQLNDRIRSLEGDVAKEIADRRAIAAELKVANAEIETQFHAVSDLENLRTVWQSRINSLLWDKAYPGEHFPSETFFPTSIFHDSGTSRVTTP
jgi:hypothetical protein